MKGGLEMNYGVQYLVETPELEKANLSYGNCKGCDKKYKDLYIKVDEGRVYGENYTAAYPCNTCIDIATRKINKEEFASYVKNVKRNMQMFEMYNLMVHKNKLKKNYMRGAASYFADDIRNPVTRLYQVTEGSNDR